MVHAIFETGGKQYRVKEGDEIYIELLDAADSTKVKFDKVLAIIDEDEYMIGTPLVDGATVTGTVIKSGKAKKIIVFKMKRRKGYRRKQGHRQPYTKIQIDKISAKGKVAKKETKAEADSAVEKPVAPKKETAAKKPATPKAEKATTEKTAAPKKTTTAKKEPAAEKKETVKKTASKTVKSEEK